MESYEIISETEKAIKVKYAYYQVCGEDKIQKFKTLWIPRFVENKGTAAMDKFVSDKIEADIKLLPLAFQRQVLSWFIGFAPNKNTKQVI